MICFLLARSLRLEGWATFAPFEVEETFGDHRHPSMAPSKKSSTKSASSNPKKQKKEKLFHPQSRKAGQLVRSHIRKSKLENLARKRSHRQASQGAGVFLLLGGSVGIGVADLTVVFLVDILGFFYLALPPEGELSLDELHLIVRDIWLPRHDKDLEQERAKRRKGRPKSTKEMQMEELKIREAEEYRTGFGSSLKHLGELQAVSVHLY